MTSSRNIPVRMPEELYQEIINNKPAELKVSTYLLLLLRKGLNAGGDVISPSVDTGVQNVDNTQKSTLIASLQSRIAGLEQQLEAVQAIVDNAQSISSESNKALSTIDTTVELAVQKAVDNCLQFVDTRIQEVVNKEMTEILGETVAWES